MNVGGRILIVDDERSLCEFLDIFLTKEGFEVETAPSGEQAIARIEAGEEFDVVMTDLMMPRVGGLMVLDAVKERFFDTEVLVMTAYATTDTAIEAMKKGAFDYLQKPFKVEEVRVVVRKALAKRQLVRENRQLRAEVRRRYSFHNIIGRSAPMQRVFELIRLVADARTTVLITGESGTGKELIARAIHHRSNRRAAAWVPVNCGAIPDNLMESELFGHVRGAFTGAHATKKGMFAAADKGTIFLDEIGDLSAHLQVKLLRVLQERRIRPVGANEEVPIDVRVIAASNQRLGEAVQDGRFREDLYYRLNVIPIEVPPLRARSEDIVPLARHFLKRYCHEMGKEIDDFEPEVLELLSRYDYPGNVRELENLVERAVTFERSQLIQPQSLPPHLLRDPSKATPIDAGELPPQGVDLENWLAKIERGMLTQALKRTGGNRTEAARLLGISFRSIRYKLDKYDIHPEEGDG